jgi:hypothetical protein
VGRGAPARARGPEVGDLLRRVRAAIGPRNAADRFPQGTHAGGRLETLRRRNVPNIPFVAIAQGRNRFAAAEIGIARPLAGFALYVVFLLAHAWLFGTRPY